MKRILITLSLLLFTVVLVNAQLLYRVSGNGIEKCSYIVGTYHLAPASFADSIPGAKSALEEVEQVCGEVDMVDMASPEGQAKVIQAMMLPEGKSLSELFSTDELAKLNAFMMNVLGADLSNPMIAAQMGKMTPMAIQNQLQLLQYMKMVPNFNPAALIDSHFQQEAMKMGKSVMGFETLDFQISVLYKGATLQRQKELLVCMLDNQEYNMMLMKELTRAYFTQDMAAILGVVEEKLGNGCDTTPEEDEALVYGRNADWVEKIPSIVSDKSTLFVVGAAHLPGERGVIKLLEAKGYRVEAVN